MLAKICFVGLTLTFFIEVNSQQSCTCAAFDACMQPFKTAHASCLSSCKTKLTTRGATQCFTTQEAAMEEMANCAKPCTASRKRRQNGPPAGGRGGPGGSGGPGGPGGPGQGPPPGWKLSGNAATELNAYDSCIKACLPPTSSSSNPFKCAQQLNCAPPTNKQSCFNKANPATICTCLQGVYGASNVVCNQKPT